MAQMDYFLQQPFNKDEACAYSDLPIRRMAAIRGLCHYAYIRETWWGYKVEAQHFVP